MKDELDEKLSDKDILLGFTPKSQWKDVYLNFKVIKKVQLQVGKFKIPFGLDETTGVSHNDFIYRSLGASYLAPARDTGVILRFIEYMDVGATNGWRLDDVVTAREIVETIDAEMPLEQVDPNYTGEVAERWRYRDGSGEIGVIASVTQAFCRDCTRARISTEGKLYTCLFATEGHDLRTLLREGASDDEIVQKIRSVWNRRSDRYSEIRTSQTVPLKKIEMSYIGG